MKDRLELYQERLHLESAVLRLIDHEDASVAVTYHVELPSREQLILKICPRDPDYHREVYFLERLAGQVAVPKVVKLVPPSAEVDGAILMECLPGALLGHAGLTSALAFEIGRTLAQVHQNRTPGYGDITRPQDLSPDARVHFSLKFHEGLEECAQRLPSSLIDQCREYFQERLPLLLAMDGPCLVHRDFRPGNIIVLNDHLQGVIDWAGGRASFAEEDFCPLEHGEWKIDAASKKGFLEGYASVRAVPAYDAVMPLLRLSRAVATVGFMIKSGRWQDAGAVPYQFNLQYIEGLLRRGQ
ncbi:MAG: phosphotransferase family protein [Chlamydiia bacterium]